MQALRVPWPLVLFLCGLLLTLVSWQLVSLSFTQAQLAVPRQIIPFARNQVISDDPGSSGVLAAQSRVEFLPSSDDSVAFDGQAGEPEAQDNAAQQVDTPTPFPTRLEVTVPAQSNPLVVPIPTRPEETAPARSNPLVVPTKREARLSGLAQQMLEQLNQQRAARNLSPLVADERLTEVARRRAADMVQRNYFSHYTPDGETVFTMMDAAGIDYYYAGENLARNTAPEDLAVSVAMEKFMESPSHRENMLNPKYRDVGIGEVSASNGWKVFALEFIGTGP